MTSPSPIAETGTRSVSASYVPQRNNRRVRWSFVALIGLFILVFSLGIGEMWLYGHQGWCGARRGIAGINTVKYGYLDTQLGPVENYGVTTPDKFDYYWHHPVLTNVLVGASFHVFGPQEFAARLVPILFSFLSFLIVYFLTRRWWGSTGAVVAGVALLLLPANALYGKLVNPEAVVLGLGLLLAWLRLRYEADPRWRWVVAGGVVTLLGCFSDWPYFLMLGVYGLIEVLVQLWRLIHHRSALRLLRNLRFLFVQIFVGACGLVLVALYLLLLKGDLILLPAENLWRENASPEAAIAALAVLLVWLRLRFESERHWGWILAGAAVSVVGALCDGPYFVILGAYGVIEISFQLYRLLSHRDPSQLLRDLHFLFGQLLALAGGLGVQKLFFGTDIGPEAIAVIALGTLLAWIRLRFETDPRWRWVLASAVVSVLGVVSHDSYFFVLGAYAATELGVQLRRFWTHRDRNRLLWDLRFFFVQIFAALFALVFVSLSLLQPKKGPGSLWDILAGAEEEKSKGAFAKLFSDRGSGDDGMSGFKVLWERQDWYLELLSPVGLVAGGLWLLAFLPRMLFRRLRAWDALIGGAFLSGMAWMLLFGKAANIHEYWCFYLIPFVALSLAWLLVSASRLLGGAHSWPSRVLITLVLAGFAGLSGAAIFERQAAPSDIERESPEYRFRNAVFAQWVHDNTNLEDRLLVQKGLPIRQATGFYLDRSIKRTRLDKRFKRLSSRLAQRHRFLILDRVRLDGSNKISALRSLSRRYPVVFFDRFCAFDLQAPDNKDEEIEAYRIVLESPTALWNWFVSMVYPPYRVEASDADAFQWALALGMDTATERLAPSCLNPVSKHDGRSSPDEMFGRIADLVASANAARLLNDDPLQAEGELERLLGAPIDAPIEDVATVEWAWSSPYFGGRIATALVLRAEKDVEEHLRPWAHRCEALSPGEKKKAERHKVWRQFEPLPESWRSGMLYVDMLRYWAAPYPQQLQFFLDRADRKERRFLYLSRTAEAARAETHTWLGLLPSEGNQKEALFEAGTTACSLDDDGDEQNLPLACLEALRPSFDRSTELQIQRMNERPRGLRIHGLRMVEGKRRRRVQLFVSVDRKTGSDYRLKLFFTDPKHDKAPSGRRSYKAKGKPRVSKFRPDELRVVSFDLPRGQGPRAVWLRASWEHKIRGGRLRIPAPHEHNRINIPLPPELVR